MNQTKTSELKDGGPIYPTDSAQGMSLRDYFACNVMASLIAASLSDVSTRKNTTPETVYSICADNAYSAADALLKARNTEKARS